MEAYRGISAAGHVGTNPVYHGTQLHSRTFLRDLFR